MQSAAPYEDERLAQPHGRLELLRTQELLRRLLPPAPASVLDVGGGTGVYAAWLAGDGYDVTLIDLVPDHVRRAQARARSVARGFAAKVRDARATGEPDESADACLLLGPLYHLLDTPDRAGALAEATRVTRRGAVVVAAAISRYGWPLDALRRSTFSADEADAVQSMLQTGLHNPKYGFTDAYLHRPAELSAELRRAGLVDIELYGVEGPAWVLFHPDISEARATELLEAALRAARLCDGDRDMVAVSSHMLALGRRP